MDQASGKSVSATTCGKGDANDAKEAELLQSFYAIPSIDKAWTSSSRKGQSSIIVVHFHIECKSSGFKLASLHSSIFSLGSLH
jgi:hypothetical protein